MWYFQVRGTFLVFLRFLVLHVQAVRESVTVFAGLVWVSWVGFAAYPQHSPGFAPLQLTGHLPGRGVQGAEHGARVGGRQPVVDVDAAPPEVRPHPRPVGGLELLRLLLPQEGLPVQAEGAQRRGRGGSRAGRLGGGRPGRGAGGRRGPQGQVPLVSVPPPVQQGVHGGAAARRRQAVHVAALR